LLRKINWIRTFQHASIALGGELLLIIIIAEYNKLGIAVFRSLYKRSLINRGTTASVIFCNTCHGKGVLRLIELEKEIFN
jgi:hypothetical protein